MTKQTATDLLTKIRTFLQYHESLGIREYPRPAVPEHFLEKEEPAPAQQRDRARKRERQAAEAAGGKHIVDADLSLKITLQDVEAEVGGCQRCRLHADRTAVIFGQGPQTAKLMIVADTAGSRDELKSGPVHGAPGELLDRMLGAIDLSRQEVYITNLVKCLPGADAKPAADEIKTCLSFLFREIEIIRPAVICAMGMQAAQALLHSNKSLFQLRGRFYDFNDLCHDKLQHEIVLMPTLHPALLLKNSELKKASWQDLQMIRKKLAES